MTSFTNILEHDDVITNISERDDGAAAPRGGGAPPLLRLR